MEERKTIFDYLGEVFLIYGIMTVIMNIFCVWIGEEAKELSSMFSLVYGEIVLTLLFIVILPQFWGLDGVWYTIPAVQTILAIAGILFLSRR